MERKTRKATKRPVNRPAVSMPRKKRNEPSRDSGMKRASLFMNGRSQSVRLPKEFRFEGTHVFVKKDGNRVILSPVDDRIERLIALMGSSPDFPDISRDDAEPIRPALKEYFDIPD